MASGYFLRDDTRISTQLVIKVVKPWERKALLLLLGCDDNAHHEIWGSNDINRKDEYLLELIISNKRYIM